MKQIGVHSLSLSVIGFTVYRRYELDQEGTNPC